MSKYLQHTVKDGERWDLLAYQYYGDATKMDLIIGANPDVGITEELQAGSVILIPLIETKPSSNDDLPPWMRD